MEQKRSEKGASAKNATKKGGDLFPIPGPRVRSLVNYSAVRIRQKHTFGRGELVKTSHSGRENQTKPNIGAAQNRTKPYIGAGRGDEAGVQNVKKRQIQAERTPQDTTLGHRPTLQNLTFGGCAERHGSEHRQ